MAKQELKATAEKLEKAEQYNHTLVFQAKIAAETKAKAIGKADVALAELTKVKAELR